MQMNSQGECHMWSLWELQKGHPISENGPCAVEKPHPLAVSQSLQPAQCIFCRVTKYVDQDNSWELCCMMLYYIYIYVFFLQ